MGRAFAGIHKRHAKGLLVLTGVLNLGGELKI
jgi:hypothetical protein